MKGAVPLRTLIFGVLIGISFLYAYVGWTGTYQLNNNITMNASFRQQYEAAFGNQSGLFATDNLSSQANTTGSLFGSTISLNSLGTAAQFLQTIPPMYTLVAKLTIGSIGSFLGINLSPLEANVLLTLTLIIIVAILSAVFLFPI